MGILRKRIRGLVSSLDEKMRLLIVYRYTSLIVASTFYYFNDVYYKETFKISIMITLVLASTILNNLYIKHRKSTKRVILLLLIETIANILLIIPTGLHRSPYLWYALNTILVAALVIDIKASVFNIFIYLGLIRIIISKIDDSQWILFELDTYNSDFNYILSLVLNIILILLLAIYLSKTISENRLLLISNNKLESANNVNNEMMNYLVEIQSALNIITLGESYEQVCNYIIDVSKKLLGAEHVFFFFNDSKGLIYKDSDIDSALFNEIVNYRNKIPTKSIDKSMDGKKFLIPIKTNALYYGDLIVYRASSSRIERFETIDLIGKIGAMAFDRVSHLKDSKELIISKEQNRIANEIHDNALQRLFGLSCNMYSLIKRGVIKDDEVLSALKSYRLSINNSMEDIRSTIYDMSLKNGNKNSLEMNVRNYLENYDDINVDLEFVGQEELLNVTEQQCIYRIISEGVSNAVRHGKSQHIKIKAEFNGSHNTLLIEDDGIGFNTQDEFSGLGLKNIKCLTSTLGGELTITSIIGEGTTLKININTKQLDKGGSINESSIS